MGNTSAHAVSALIALVLSAACGNASSPAGPSGDLPLTVAGLTVFNRAGLQSSTVFAFVAYVSGAQAGPVTYNWDFGDGATATGAAVSHVYDTTGPFVVTVVAGDGVSQASRETSVSVKDLSGTWVWQHTPGLGNPSSSTLMITQRDSMLEATYIAEFNGSIGVPLTFTGFVSTTPPAFTLSTTTLQSCGGPVAPQMILIGRVNSDVTSLVDVRQCICQEHCVGSGSGGPFVRQ